MLAAPLADLFPAVTHLYRRLGVRSIGGKGEKAEMAFFVRVPNTSRRESKGDDGAEESGEEVAGSNRHRPVKCAAECSAIKSAELAAIRTTIYGQGPEAETQE